MALALDGVGGVEGTVGERDCAAYAVCLLKGDLARVRHVSDIGGWRSELEGACKLVALAGSTLLAI